MPAHRTTLPSRRRAGVRRATPAPAPTPAPGLWARLAYRRLTLGKTQGEIEQAAELPPTSLSRYERAEGAPIPRAKTLEKLALALDMTVAELLVASADQAAREDAVRMFGQKVVAYRNRIVATRADRAVESR